MFLFLPKLQRQELGSLEKEHAHCACDFSVQQESVLTAQLVFVKGLQHDHLRNILAPHEALHTFAGNRMML